VRAAACEECSVLASCPRAAPRGYPRAPEVLTNGVPGRPGAAARVACRRCNPLWPYRVVDASLLGHRRCAWRLGGQPLGYFCGTGIASEARPWIDPSHPSRSREPNRRHDWPPSSSRAPAAAGAGGGSPPPLCQPPVNLAVYRSPSTSITDIESVDCYWPVERCILYHDPKTSARTSRRDHTGQFNSGQKR